MAALFGKLVCPDLALPVSVAIFGAAIPLVVYSILSVSVLV